MSGKKGEHEPEKEGVLATIWDYAKTFLLIFLVVFALNKLVYTNAVIPSESMQTTIMKGDRIIGSRLAYKSKDPQRFDIVIFKYPDDPSKIFIKRVIGLPGETVEIKEGKLLIDGKPLKAEYVSDIGYAGTASEPVHLGKDEYFLLGDNETASDDSREEKIGNIKKKEIYGEVWFVIKPWSDIGFVSD